jgi:hypothetical protein
MSHRPESIATMRMGSDKSARKKLKQSISLSLVIMALTHCAYQPSRDVLAYNLCIARHPSEAPICEGPRQAYRLDLSASERGAAATSALTAGSDQKQMTAAPLALGPEQIHPNPTASAPHG